MTRRTEDNAVVRVHQIKEYQIIEAIKEPRLYFTCLAVITTHMQTGGLLIFSAQFIKTLGDFTVIFISNYFYIYIRGSALL